MFKSIFQISILILLLFSNDVHGWCSPSDSGDCELKIRSGKKSTDALNNILKLNVRDYEWKKNDKKQRGFIAQEVEKILPNAVHIVNDTSTAGSRNISDLRLLNLDPIIFDLVGSVQALQNQILAERNKRIELETEIKNLKRI